MVPLERAVSSRERHQPNASASASLAVDPPESGKRIDRSILQRRTAAASCNREHA
jgi:hypothetical protein